MKSAVGFLALAMLCGCNHGNTVAPNIEPILSARAVKDSMLYTFAIPRSTFAVQDTLQATLSLYNQSAFSDTIITPILAPWSLQTDSGRTIMYGPWVFPNFRRRTVLPSHQSFQQEIIDQFIVDTSGSPVMPGSYILRDQFSTLSFTLEITVH